MRMYGYIRFPQLVDDLCKDLLKAPTVEQQTWHAMDVKGQAHLVAHELQHFVWEGGIPVTLDMLQDWVKPNLPWAEEHFLERVSGEPLNPPPSHENWPFAMAGNDTHLHDGMFSHTYPERFWPKLANGGISEDFTGRDWGDDPHFGIRFPYGDLADVVALLVKEPTTRQAYLPVWFPEDTGAVEGQRLPCSLGYHFMIRDNMLSVSYYMRSCDFVRHFRDDVYMAMRLAQWVCEQVNERLMVKWTQDVHATELDPVVVDSLFLSIASLHCFEGDRRKMERREV